MSADGAVQTEMWPLVGRERQLVDVAAALADPTANALVLCGPPGTGKTRLATECLRIGARSGYSTARATATRSATSIPLGALASLLPELPPETPNLVTWARRALARDTPIGQLLLLVDDAHLLDPASATLLLGLVAAGDAFVIVTVRDDAPVPDAVRSLWKDGFAARIDLGPLDRDDTDDLVALVLRGEVDRELCDEVWRLSRGNPLAVREGLYEARRAGAIGHTAADAPWRLLRPLDIPAALSETVAARLDSLSEAERSALETIALGEPLPLDVVLQLSEPEAVERLEADGLVSARTDEDGGLAVWLGHPLHGEVLRRQLPVLRRRRLSVDIVTALDERLRRGRGRPGDALRVVLWQLDLGMEPAPDALVEAARRSYAALDLATAVRLAEAAWERAPTVESGQLVGFLRCELGEFDRGAEVLAKTGSLASTDEEVFLVAATHADSLAIGFGRASEGLAILEDACDRVQDPAIRDELLARRARIVQYEESPRAARDMVEPLLADPSSPAFPEAAMVAGLSYLYDGQPAAGYDLFERAQAHFSRTAAGTSLSPSLTASSQVFCLVHMGDVTGAMERGEALWRLTVEEGSRAGVRRMAYSLGGVALDRGRPQSAVGWLRLALDGVSLQTMPRSWLFANSYLAMAHAQLGEPEAAGRELERMTAAAHGLFRHTFLPVARAWATAAAGDLAGAADILDAAVSYAVTSTRTFAVLMLHDLARLGGADRAARWIRQLEPPDGAMLRVRLAYIDALARGDADELEEQARAFGTMGADLLAAEAWAEASALLAGTNGRRSTAASHRASALLRRCEGARTPSLAHLVPTEDLSEREREVAVLAGAGLSSQQIADQLFVSVKTVSNHLQHAYDKLGASGRVELAELLEL